MRLLINSRIWLVGLLLAFGAVACDLQQSTNGEATSIPPSITLKPPFLSQTPAFTATPTYTVTPAITDTFTPSPTSTVSVTPIPTLTLTPTAAIQGSIFSAQNVNVREEANTNSGVVVTVQPNREVDIIGAEENNLSQIWYYIGFIGDDDEYHQGYVTERLVDDGGQAIPTLGPTFTPTIEGAEPEFTAVPFMTATPAEGEESTSEGELTPSRDLSDENILAYCVQDRITPATPTTDETVSIYWRWWVVSSRPELMDDHLEHVEYEVFLDDKQLTNWADFEAELIQDSTNLNRWTVFWYVPVGKLEAGEHTIEYRVSWREQISDGLGLYGPNSAVPEETGNCTFTVIQGEIQPTVESEATNTGE